MPGAKHNTGENEQPPLFKSWNTFYVAVMANLVFWLAMFYIVRLVFE